MSLREDLLGVVQQIRDIPVDMGLRQFEVWSRLVVWSGTRIGVGTATSTDTYLGRVKVKVASSKDVVGGASALSYALYTLGPFTPENSAAIAASHTKAPTYDELSPPQDGNASEIYYVLKGPGLDADGILCQRVGDDLSKSFRNTVTVKSTGRKAA